MMPDDLSREIILEHSQNPRNFGLLEGATHLAGGSNPMCGDEIRLQLQAAGGVISAARFTGRGCAICVASASLMTKGIQGQTLDAAHALLRQFGAALTCGESEAPSLPGDLAALAGVRHYPQRVKCAMLAWEALRQILAQLAPWAGETRPGA